MVSIKHPFQSAKGDGPDTTRVRPSNWNANHDIEFSSANRYLGRDQTGDGDGQELPIVPEGVGDDGTMWTAAKVQAHVAAAIAAAVASVQIPTGTIVGSIQGNMVGFLPLNGSSFGPPGSGATFTSASYQALFTLIWTVIPTYPINGGRGASAAADWTALKTMTLPNTAGATIGAGGVGLMSGQWLTVVGEASHQLTLGETPAHTHTVNTDAGANLGGGVAGGGNVLQQTAGGPLVTSSAGDTGFHNNIQPTMIMQVWWIKY